MLDNKDLFKSGLCQWVVNLHKKSLITLDEGNILIDYINDNKPTKDWSLSRLFLTPNVGFFWRKGCIYPRIVWIKKHLNK
jgi:hypothetical protein